MKQSLVVDPSRARDRLAEQVRRRSIAIADVFDSHDAEELRGIQPRLGDLLRQVAGKWCLPVKQVIAHSRIMRGCRARQEYYYAAMTKTTRSTRVIGRICGDRDHSTVLYGAAAHARRNSLPAPRGVKLSGVKKFSYVRKNLRAMA